MCEGCEKFYHYACISGTTTTNPNTNVITCENCGRQLNMEIKLG